MSDGEAAGRTVGGVSRRGVLRGGGTILGIGVLASVAGPASAAWDDLAWGYPNGAIPPDKMVKLWNGMLLEKSAAAQMESMNAAFRQSFGMNMSMTGTYRSLATQEQLFTNRYQLAPTGSGVTKVYQGKTWYLKNGQAMSATPGTSNHGYARAVDFTTGAGLIGTKGTAQHNWVKAHCGTYGWVHPTWAWNGGPDDEPWHFEYTAGGSTSAGPDPDVAPIKAEDDTMRPFFIRRNDGAIVIVGPDGVRPLDPAQWQTWVNLGYGLAPGMDAMDPGPFEAVVSSLGGLKY